MSAPAGGVYVYILNQSIAGQLLCQGAGYLAVIQGWGSGGATLSNITV